MGMPAGPTFDETVPGLPGDFGQGLESGLRVVRVQDLKKPQGFVKKPPRQTILWNNYRVYKEEATSTAHK